MEFNNIVVGDFMSAIRAARMPFKSFNKMDSHYIIHDPQYSELANVNIGDYDMQLLQNLLKAGDSDAKFMRSIDVSVEITAPVYFLNELDTYKIATVRNSSSLQHTGSQRNYAKTDFSFDEKPDNWNMEDWKMSEQYIYSMLEAVNYFRTRYKETNDYSYFRAMRQAIPMSFNYTIAWHSNYAVLRNIWKQRIKHPHRLKEWTEDFAGFINKLPYSEELIKYEG